MNEPPVPGKALSVGVPYFARARRELGVDGKTESAHAILKAREPSSLADQPG